MAVQVLSRPRSRGSCRRTSLNQVALTVSDLVRSAALCGEHFGLTERLHEDDHLLILGSDDGPSSRSRKGSRSPESFLARTTSASGWRTRLPSGPRATPSGAAGVVETEWQDVEKRRPAPLTR
jgi:hypothetical protein